MSQKIDPREVLAYLNELGYTNISAQQLKEFITDLKKLIKYENKLRTSSIEKENIIPVPKTNYYHEEKCDIASCPHRRTKCATETSRNENDFFNSLYNHPTVASKAKEVPRPEKQISVHIVRPKSKSPRHDHCIHPEKQITDNESQLQFVNKMEVSSEGSKLEIETESIIKGIRPLSKQTESSRTSSSKTIRPKSSFIRPGISKPFNKCDPVALYHYYQNVWKNQKIPGQENHSDLRWAVRERLLGGPKIASISRPSSCRRSCVSWKG